MLSSIIRNPAKPDDDFKAQQELEFDRWRKIAEEIDPCLYDLVHVEAA
jgi:hypothetical protein